MDFRNIHIVVMQQQLRNVQESVLQQIEQTFLFPYLNLFKLLFAVLVVLTVIFA